jgi:RNA-directed DNA polymerase
MSFPFEDYVIKAEELGKSKDFISLTLAYAKNLDNKGFPVIFSLENLALLMGLQSDYLRALTGEAKNNSSNPPFKLKRYSYFKLKKERGGYREIASPSKDLKYIQKWILKNILEKYPLTDNCIGFREGLSIYDNAKPHENKKYILKLDLLKFYDTITEKRVYGVFSSFGYSKNLAVSLAKLLTVRHRSNYWQSFDTEDQKILKDLIDKRPAILPQGSPASPTIANIIANNLDKRIIGLSKKYGFKYTRYADDLTFSANHKKRLPKIKLITEIILEEGFQLNKKKIRVSKMGSKQYVTGLTTSNGINVSKKYRKEINSQIHYCKKHGVKSHLKHTTMSKAKNKSILVYHDWLYGHICFIKSINKKAGNKLLEEFKKIDWFLE